MSWPTDRFPTSSEIYARLSDIAGDSRFSGVVSVADLPNTTAGGRKTAALTIGRPGGTKPTLVICGGVHSREWAPPAALVNLAFAILDAWATSSQVTMGSTSRAAEDVKAIVETTKIVIAPMINPDGYMFSLMPPPGGDIAKKRMWRKNRAPAPSIPFSCADPDDAIGVDINRNFGVLWKAEDFYTASAVFSSSPNPCDETFRGLSAFSEPETRNVRSLLDTHEPEIYIDVHMFGQTVGHSWGVEQNKPGLDPTPVLDPTRVRDGTLLSPQAGFNGYTEAIGTLFLSKIKSLAEMMADATLAASGKRYAPGPSAVPTSIAGASDDFAFSRNLGTSKPHIKAYTIECGTSFLPDFATEFAVIQAQVQAALMVAMRSVATTPTSSPPPATTPGTGSGSSDTPSDPITTCRC